MFSPKVANWLESAQGFISVVFYQHQGHWLDYLSLQVQCEGLPLRSFMVCFNRSSLKDRTQTWQCEDMLLFQTHTQLSHTRLEILDGAFPGKGHFPSRQGLWVFQSLFCQECKTQGPEEYEQTSIIRIYSA